MKKLFLTSALIIGLSLGSTTVLAADKINVLASGMPLTFSASDGCGIPFIDQNGRTQLPLRKCVASLGAEVDYRQDTQEIIITKGATNISLKIGEEFIYINGETAELDTAAVLIDNRTYLPIRPIAEALGYQVKWEADEKTVIIDQNLTADDITIVDLSSRLQAYASKNCGEWFVSDGKLYYYDKDNNLVRGDLHKQGLAQIIRAMKDEYTEETLLNPPKKCGNYILSSYATAGMTGSVKYFLTAADGSEYSFVSSTMMPLNFACDEEYIVITGTDAENNLQIVHNGTDESFPTPEIKFNIRYIANDAQRFTAPIITEGKVYTAAYQSKEKAYYLAEIDLASKKVNLLAQALPQKMQDVNGAVYYLADNELWLYQENENVLLAQNITDFAVSGEAVYVADNGKGLCFLENDGKLRLIAGFSTVQSLEAADGYVLAKLDNNGESFWLLLDDNGNIAGAVMNAREVCYASGKIYAEK